MHAEEEEEDPIDWRQEAGAMQFNPPFEIWEIAWEHFIKGGNIKNDDWVAMMLGEKAVPRPKGEFDLSNGVFCSTSRCLDPLKE